jgi:hypothetical protein
VLFRALRASLQGTVGTESSEEVPVSLKKISAIRFEISIARAQPLRQHTDFLAYLPLKSKFI